MTIDDVVALRTHEIEPVRSTLAVLGVSYTLMLAVVFVLGYLTFALTFAG